MLSAFTQVLSGTVVVMVVNSLPAPVAHSPKTRPVPPAAILTGFAGALTVFVVLAVVVAGHPGPFGIDASVMAEFTEHRLGWLTSVATVLSVVTDPAATAAIVLAVAAWLFLRVRDRGSAAFLVATALVAAIALEAGKILVDRPRPPAAFQAIAETNYSFPSGHVTSAVAIFGALAVVAHVRGLPRLLVWGAWLALVAAVLVDRLYLGVHWVSDVAGGALLGSAILLLAVYLRQARPQWFGLTKR